MGNGDNRWAAGCAPIKFKMFFERKKISNRQNKRNEIFYFSKNSATTTNQTIAFISLVVNHAPRLDVVKIQSTILVVKTKTSNT